MATDYSGKAMERYVPAGEIEDRQAAELALVGLSSNFPAVVSELNDTLDFAIDHPFNFGSFTGYRFTLRPDPKRPRVDVEEARYFPFDVTIEADVLKHGVFSVLDRDNTTSRLGIKALNWVELNPLLEFAANYPGGHDIRFKSDGGTKPSDLDIHVTEADDAFIERLREDISVRQGLRIEFQEDEYTGLNLPLEFNKLGGRVLTNFGVAEITARAPAEEIETIIGLYIDLLMARDDAS